MISLPEAANAIYGAWRLARFDASGIDRFDSTAEVFWRSFYAMAIVAPGHVFIIMPRLDELRTALAQSGYTLATGAGPIAMIVLIGFVVRWFAFPLIMVRIADRLDRGARYFRFIAAFNWATVLVTALLVAAFIVVRSAVLPAAIAPLLVIGSYAAVLAYLWFVTRVGLDVDGRPAAAVVGLYLAVVFAVRLCMGFLLGSNIVRSAALS